MAKEKSIFKTLSLILLSMFFILNNISQKVYATENLPEVTIHANNSGLKVQESNGDYKRGDNILTKFADVFLEGNSMYTSDSKTGNDLNGSDPRKNNDWRDGMYFKNRRWRTNN